MLHVTLTLPRSKSTGYMWVTSKFRGSSAVMNDETRELVSADVQVARPESASLQGGELSHPQMLARCEN